MFEFWAASGVVHARRKVGGDALLPAQQPQDELGDDFFRELAGTEHIVAARDQDGQIVGANVCFRDELCSGLAAGVWVCGLHDR